MQINDLISELNKIKQERVSHETEFLGELSTKRQQLMQEHKASMDAVLNDAKKTADEYVMTARDEATKEAERIRIENKVKIEKLKFDEKKFRNILTTLYGELGI